MSILSKTTNLGKRQIGRKVPQGCLECEGDLLGFKELYQLELFGKPLFTIGWRRAHVYQCQECEQTFLPSVKYHSFLTSKERTTEVDSSNDLYARLMVASLAYTANIDGKFSNKEDELLELVMSEASEFPSTAMVLRKVIDLGKGAGTYVFSVFDFARQHLSREKLESVIVANARMVLVDGKIKKAERKLLRRYLKAAGIKMSMTNLLARAHSEQYGNNSIENQR